MKLKFLCNRHRTFLTNNPEQAINTCLTCADKGTALLQQHRYVDAVPYFGNAFETAEIVLSSGVIQPGSALDWFLAASGGLTEALELLDKRAEAKEIYLLTRDCLRRELPRAPGRQVQITQQLAWVDTRLRRLQKAPELDLPRDATQSGNATNVYFHPTASRSVH